MDNYVQEAVRTDTKNYTGVVNGIDNKTMRLLHGALGVCTEAGELLDALKKKVMYGKDIDYVNVKEEVGDILWYLAIILDETGSSFDEVMQVNIAKLKKRYPDKFTSEAAINRDVEAERKVLEGQSN